MDAYKLIESLSENERIAVLKEIKKWYELYRPAELKSNYLPRDNSDNFDPSKVLLSSHDITLAKTGQGIAFIKSVRSRLKCTLMEAKSVWDYYKFIKGSW